METIDLIKEATNVGAIILVVDGKLKGKNLDKIDQGVRDQLKVRREEVIRILREPPVGPNLKLCSICGGRNFIHGHKGGYFCTTCQPDARPGDPVRAGDHREERELM